MGGRGGSLTPFFFTQIFLPPNFNFLGKPLLGEKYVERRKKKKEEKERKNNAKFSGHYVRRRTHNVRANTLCSHQNITKKQSYILYAEALVSSGIQACVAV